MVKVTLALIGRIGGKFRTEVFRKSSRKNKGVSKRVHMAAEADGSLKAKVGEEEFSTQKSKKSFSNGLPRVIDRFASVDSGRGSCRCLGGIICV